MRAVRETVSSKAMLQLSKIWPHRNPVHDNKSMWLLRGAAQLPGLPVEE